MRRIYHHWESWECVDAGMYDIGYRLISKRDPRRMYAEFLGDIDRFNSALDSVTREWPISCEQFLSNESINRVAWLGQASMCIDTGVPAVFRSGFFLLTKMKQGMANDAAGECLRSWIDVHDKEIQQCLAIW